MRFCTMTLGCKVNQYETKAIESILQERGNELVNAGEGCDVCIINTCAVTSESVRKSQQTIRRLKKLEPEAFIAVCGCYSQLDPEEAAKPEINLVGGVFNRKDFALYIEKYINNRKTNNQAEIMKCGFELVEFNCLHGSMDAGGREVETRTFHLSDSNCNLTDSKPHRNCYQENRPIFEELPPGSATKQSRTQSSKSSRTRVLLKIQDGCNNFCTYCIVPYIRGRSRSLSPERVKEYAQQLEQQGYKEIVITGIEISSYGKDLEPEPSLLTAVQTISNAAPNARLRLGSLDPSILTDEMCSELGKIPNLCNHFHLSLQSGCDETLKRMGRKYTTSQVMQSITTLRTHFKDCGITADLITGFPGETSDEFNQTMEFIHKAAFSGMHIFPYSIRPGTKAAAMPGQIEKPIKKERARLAIKAATEMENKFKKEQIGKTVTVLFEQEKNGFNTGHTSNYLEIAVKKSDTKNMKNTIKNVKITTLKSGKLQGEIV